MIDQEEIIELKCEILYIKNIGVTKPLKSRLMSYVNKYQ